MSERKNKKIKILVGVPASGKSTWARKELARNPNVVSVSRDDFRYGLRNSGVTEPKIESMITELVDSTIMKSLSFGLDVISDATNLKKSYIEHFINLVKHNADVEFIVFDISLEVALERDRNRERSVGEHVIKKMYKNYKDLLDSYALQNLSKRPESEQRFNKIVKTNPNLVDCVIFDIDGTLAHMSNRSPYDWNKVDRDDVNELVHEQVNYHKSLGREIIIFTGRDEESREKTKYWLDFYKIHYDHLYMRVDGDMRKDNLVKKEMFQNHIIGKYHPICVYDDRLQVVKMWYELGGFCFNVNQGNHEF